MNDLFTNSQFDVVSVGRWGGLVLSCICFSSVKLLKDLVKDPTESLEDSGYNCMSKGKSASEPFQTLQFSCACC